MREGGVRTEKWGSQLELVSLMVLWRSVWIEPGSESAGMGSISTMPETSVTSLLSTPKVYTPLSKGTPEMRTPLYFSFPVLKQFLNSSRIKNLTPEISNMGTFFCPIGVPLSGVPLYVHFIFVSLLDAILIERLPNTDYDPAFLSRVTCEDSEQHFNECSHARPPNGDCTQAAISCGKSSSQCIYNFPHYPLLVELFVQ